MTTSLGSGRRCSYRRSSPGPLRDDDEDEALALATLLGRLELWAVDEGTANLAAAIGAGYGLKAADATHLATAIAAGADRFITNNRRDLPTEIVEVDITYPDDLPDVSSGG